jgi:hypothetical protein
VDEALFETFLDVVYRRGRDLAVERFRRMHPGDADAVIADYDLRIAQVKNGFPPKILAAPGRRDDGWYAGPQPNDSFWPPFEDYLATRKKWPETSLRNLDEVSSKIIGFGHNPALPEFRTKGLVVGHVQSGKTTNFTAVVGKAADVGFRVIIILSGVHNGLRTQTQLRLKEQLFDLHASGWIEMTDADRDFHTPTQSAVSLLQPGGQKVAVFVVKKWHTVLTKLIDWLKKARPVLASIPALIIDDEADQASVDTKQINPKINDLLKLFPRATYLGYTATPFANVLIDPSDDDLYPESFIVSLPRQDTYFGAETIFGRDAVEGDARGADLDGHDMVRIIDDSEVDALRPAGKSTAGFVPELTESLRAAVQYFWSATAARRVRGDDGHSTMLIHTSMKTAVHEAFRPMLEDFRQRVRVGLRGGDLALIETFEAQWRDEESRVQLGGHPAIPFETLLPRLQQVVDDTTILLDNCRSRERLDYTGDPVTAIAVGGNTLSRGLTLEGLVTSFFIRSASTYDTLLQMGRWFGYRPGYEDLPRIWMTDRLRSWFRHLAAVEHEIRLDIERYEEQDLSPRDVGVRIRTHPVLNVTAKMGAFRIAHASYGGRRVQTRYFRENDGTWLRDNLEAGRTLVEAALDDGTAVEGGDGRVLLREVDVRHVLDFLEAYHVHEDSPDLDTALVVKYIRRENRQADPSLLTWTVALMGSTAQDGDDAHRVTFAPGVTVGTVNRSKLKDTGGDKANIKTLMSKEDRVVDLDITPAEARRRSEASLIESRDLDPRHHRQGLILVYPIDKDSPPDEANTETRRPLAAEEHVLGMALVFPGTAEDIVTNSYISVDLRDQAIDADDVDEERAALSDEDA